MTCREMMTENPKCCLPDDSIVRAAEIMRDEDVGPVPVVNDHSSRRLVGIVTDRDITLEVVAAGRDPKSTRVGSVMSTDLVTCGVDDDYAEVLDAMAENQVRRIPVLNADGSLAGIISQADVALGGSDEEVAGVVEEISEPSWQSSVSGLLRRGRRRNDVQDSEPGFGVQSLLMGAACLSLGAGIMYLLDGSSGGERRAKLRDKASNAYRNLRHKAEEVYENHEMASDRID